MPSISVSSNRNTKLVRREFVTYAMASSSTAAMTPDLSAAAPRSVANACYSPGTPYRCVWVGGNVFHCSEVEERASLVRYLYIFHVLLRFICSICPLIRKSTSRRRRRRNRARTFQCQCLCRASPACDRERRGREERGGVGKDVSCDILYSLSLTSIAI